MVIIFNCKINFDSGLCPALEGVQLPPFWNLSLRHLTLYFDSRSRSSAKGKKDN